MTDDEKETEPRLEAATAELEPDALRLARAGYEGYSRYTGGKTFDGRTMPTFDALEHRIKAAWAAAATGILAEAAR